MAEPNQELLKECEKRELIYRGSFSDLKPSLAIDGE